MKELAKRFMDKECIIASFDGNHQYEGIIKEVTDGAILLEKDGKIEALNLDFVMRIREYPRKKNGKKRAKLLTLKSQKRKDLKNYFIYPAKKCAVLREKLIQFYLILTLANIGSED